MFEGFELDFIDTGEAVIRVRRGGSGPPLLLLHGHPQTHVMWHKIAPRLAGEFTVIATDLRGYGESSKPATTPDPETIHAMCEDYRAGATIDYEMDEADRGSRRIACPVLALWGGRAELEKWYDVLAIWRDWADEVQGRALDCGHFLAEEAPDETFAALREFFSA